MSKRRIRTATVASILILLGGLFVQAFGHVGHADDLGGEPRTRQELYCFESGELTPSDRCPACLLMLQARSLGPPVVVPDEVLDENGPVLATPILRSSVPHTHSTGARAPPHSA